LPVGKETRERKTEVQVTERVARDLPVAAIFRLWFPLAVSFELMMLEGPAVQAAIGRLPDPALNLAAWGLTWSLSLLIESPVVMLLATAIALVKDDSSYRALRRFVIDLCLLCTAVTGLVAFTPVFDLVANHVLRQPPEIADGARPAMQILLLWTAAIGWRRFYQGILIRHGRTRLISWGTTIRLGVTIVTAAVLTRAGGLSGAAVGACALILAVISEAVATTLFSLPVVRSEVVPAPPPDEKPLSQREILRFHLPLAGTTLLTLVAQPLTSAGLAVLALPERNLAAAPVVFMLLLVMRGWGLALQEITVALARRPEAQATLKRFAWIVGLASSGATALIAFTPLMDLYLGRILNVPTDLWGPIRAGVNIAILLPLITALGSWARGLLVARGRSMAVYHGMALNIVFHGVLLGLGVSLRLPGMWAAAGAFTLAAIIELVYLLERLSVDP
jgi:progressive ankylosis protein